MFEYQDKVDEIDSLLSKMRNKWQLDSIQWMGYDDVSQHIRRHIWLKWDLWDQSRSFGPWCRTLINNQIRNLIRNNYKSFARPCLGCPHNMGGDACGLTKSQNQDESCEDFAKWKKKKSHIYGLKIPVPIEDRDISTTVSPNDNFNFEESAANLHRLMLIELPNEKQRKIYTMLYIKGMSDNEVGKAMGFTPDNVKNGSRYKQLNNLKKKFAELAKKILEYNDVIR